MNDEDTCKPKDSVSEPHFIQAVRQYSFKLLQSAWQPTERLAALSTAASIVFTILENVRQLNWVISRQQDVPAAGLCFRQ